MTNRQRQYGRGAAVAAMVRWLLVLTLGLRALLAPGLMPAFAADGPTRLAICTQVGERWIATDAVPGETAPTDHIQAPCLFASAGFTSLGPTTPPLLGTPMAGSLVQPSATPVAAAPEHADGHGLARGPPPVAAASTSTVAMA